jgi:NADH:ubiquinone oxidoreductase subunit 2 (subunit N)
MTVFTFALAGVCLVGLPPSGGFWAKSLLLGSAVATGQWWWAIIILAGSLLTAGYVFLVLRHAMAPTHEPLKSDTMVPRYQEAAALSLALCSLLLGFAAFGPSDVIQIGRIEPAWVGSR